MDFPALNARRPVNYVVPVYYVKSRALTLGFSVLLSIVSVFDRGLLGSVSVSPSGDFHQLETVGGRGMSGGSGGKDGFPGKLA